MQHVDIASPADYSALQLDNQLCFGLYAASHLMTKAYRPFLKDIGLTYPQFLVLLVLWEKKSQTVSALGDALLLDSGTLSPLLKRLESAGFVQKTRRQDDERQVIVTLTAKGEELRAGAAAARQQVVRLLGMTDVQITMMRRDMALLMEALDQEACNRQPRPLA